MVGEPRVRARDVAEAVGVSTATVSYVLNNTPGQKISDATARRVREAAHRLGYVSNPAAQALARGSSNLVVVDMSDFYAREIGMQIGERVLTMLERLGFDAFMTWWSGGSASPERSARLISLVRATNPRTVLSILPLPIALQEGLERVGRQSQVSIAANAHGHTYVIGEPAAVQIDYLHEQGHTQMFYVASLERHLEQLVAIRREKAKHTAAALNMHLITLPAFADVPHLKALLAEAMAAHPGVTAIAAFNDRDAVSTLFALHLLGVEVPERMALMGVDDLDIAEEAHPQLTSIRTVPKFEAVDAARLREVILNGGAFEEIGNCGEAMELNVIVRGTA